LSLSKAIINAVMPKPKKKPKRGEVIKTLIDSFRYPRRGPGMMWEACTAKVREMGNEVLMGQRVTGSSYDAQKRLWTVTHVDAQGQEHKVVAQHVISSAPMRELVNNISPAPSAEAISAANALKYRDFLTVVLIIRDKDVFNDNWIYIHD